MAFPGLGSLTGGGGLSASESGDAVSGVGGIRIDVGGINGSPLRAGAFGLDPDTLALLAVAALGLAVFMMARR